MRWRPQARGSDIWSFAPPVMGHCNQHQVSRNATMPRRRRQTTLPRRRRRAVERVAYGTWHATDYVAHRRQLATRNMMLPISEGEHRTARPATTMSLASRFESAVQRRCGLTLRPCRTVRYALLGQLVRCAATVANVRVVRGQLALTQLETARELGTHVLASMLPLCTRAQHRRAHTHDTHHARSHHLLGR